MFVFQLIGRHTIKARRRRLPDLASAISAISIGPLCGAWIWTLATCSLHQILLENARER